MNQLKILLRQNKVLAILLVLLIYCSSANAQILAKNHVYGHDRLEFNEFFVVGKHKILRLTDRMDEDRRMLYLLNESNEVTDQMKCSAIEDFVVLGKHSFLIKDLNWNVTVDIEGESFNVREIKRINMRTTGLDMVLANHVLGVKYDRKKDCVDYVFCEDPDSLTGFKRECYKYEWGTYKMQKHDYVQIFIDRIPPVYVGLDKSLKRRLKKNQLVESKIVISTDETQTQRTSRIYGWDNWETDGDNIYFYEKNSCSLYVFDNQMNRVGKYGLPVKNKAVEGWRYYYDTQSKQHYFVRRLREPHQGYVTLQYQLFKLNLEVKKLELVLVSKDEPQCISNEMVYAIVHKEKGNDIVAYTLDPKYQFEESVYLDDVEVVSK
ncbi:hypothetical protein EYV94_19875 [Puteibacter caeruleilacunae]|nr:hypothetical protein EYV94_19875 [Puteibacter caeruleilacunae]